MADHKKRRRRRRRPIDPRKLERLRHRRKLKSLLARIGFLPIQSDGVTFTFDGRTGEIDGIFLQENIVLICEYTTGAATGEHLSKKSILFGKIQSNEAGFISEYSTLNPRFKKAIDASRFQIQEFHIRIIYASSGGVSDEIEHAFPKIKFLDGTRLRYFDALSHTIHKSARHEFFKYLQLSYSDIGDQVHSTQVTSQTFSGHVLPEAHSSYPSGFKVVSFYADPKTLLALSYVLRQDSWRDKDGLYQRILIKSKIARMRRYLLEVKRVFVNNIIVTLPADTALNDPQRPGRNVDPSKLTKVTPVSVTVPSSANMIGLVDGQHRVFCYYESHDAQEHKIAPLRARQNLLVTGLIFPESWSEGKKREFEARLFLEINDTQARAKSALKQSIELILNPFSTLAIAKEVTNRLANKGPLSDLLQTNFFDPPSKIKTTSIVSYGLKPLVKTEGRDSLFRSWQNAHKLTLLDQSAPISRRRELLEDYVGYCVERINSFLLAAKLSTGPEKWKLTAKPRDNFLTPTVINGFFVCLRRLAEHSKLGTHQRYETALKGVSSFAFSRYKSSGWRALGDKLFSEYFGA